LAEVCYEILKVAFEARFQPQLWRVCTSFPDFGLQLLNYKYNPADQEHHRILRNA
jgi:hypothetical protein